MYLVNGMRTLGESKESVGNVGSAGYVTEQKCMCLYRWLLGYRLKDQSINSSLPFQGCFPGKEQGSVMYPFKGTQGVTKGSMVFQLRI